jgi:hypothetical protein
MDNWILCEEDRTCCGENKWHIISEINLQNVNKDKPWFCDQCKTPQLQRTISIRSNLSTLKDESNCSDPFSIFATQSQRDKFFDLSSQEWLRNKRKVFDENGFCTGYEYKTKRMRSLLASCPKRKRPKNKL